MRPDAFANLARALSSPRRAAIIKLLIESKEMVASSTIASVLGIRDGDASYNLIKLAEVGLVLRQVHGRWVFYAVNRSLLNEVQRFLDAPAHAAVVTGLPRVEEVCEDVGGTEP